LKKLLGPLTIYKYKNKNMNYKYIGIEQPKGISQTSDYKRWRRIRECCLNVKRKGYENYGGRGIKMYEDWINNPLAFIEYIKSLENYGKGLTIDRIDNDGNYEPGNLRWVNYHYQGTNKRMQKRNTSGFTGICYCKFHGKYEYYAADIYYYNKNKRIGYFKTKEEAVKARNDFIIQNNLFEYKLQ